MTTIMRNILPCDTKDTGSNKWQNTQPNHKFLTCFGWIYKFITSHIFIFIVYLAEYTNKI